MKHSNPRITESELRGKSDRELRALQSEYPLITSDASLTVNIWRNALWAFGRSRNLW